jgi:hypothetical protein
MKNLIPIFILAMISTIAIAGEDLSLSCDGKVNVSMTLKDGTESISEATKKNSFLFRDGYLIKNKLKIKCDWTDQEIQCHNYEELIGTQAAKLTLFFTIDRITGIYSLGQSWWNPQGEIYLHEEFSGSCASQKRKF